MKIGLKLVAALFVAFLVAGCGNSDNGGGEEEQPVDGWMLSKMGGSSSVSGTVYLQLNSNNTFNLYQSIGAMGYRILTGTYTLATDAKGAQIMSGVYSDQKPWKSNYQVVTKAERNMTIKSVNEAIVYDYVAVTIPGYVKDGVTDADVASRVEFERFL